MSPAPPLAPLNFLSVTVICAYFALLLSVGWAFKRFNRTTSDYFRGGQRGTWWLVGTSIYVSMISAWTFTGGAAQAYDWGWGIMWNYWPGGLGFLLCALVFAAWFRQLRATTGPEAIGMRFNEATRQIMGWKNVLGTPLLSALHLYGLATFASAVFGFDVATMIIAMGLVVTIYSTTGGRFAVMANDFIQAAIVLPMGAVVAWLSLRQIGGWQALLDGVEAANLTERFAFIKNAEQIPANGTYGLAWIAAAILFFMVLNNLNVGVAARFFSVKDSREARWAAWLTVAMIGFTVFLWFIPPIVARLLYASEVAAIPLKNPAEGAYALVAVKLLPASLVSMMLVAIFAATLSSVDTALNGNTAIVMRDLYPAIWRLLGREQAGENAQLAASRWITFAFGGLVTLVALTYAQLKELSLFDLMMNVLALTGMPFQIPLFWGLFVRRVPRWAAIFSGIATIVPALIMFFDTSLLGFAVTWQARVLVQFSIGTATFFLSMLWWPRVSAADRAHIDAFFKRMHMPVDFEAEVGEASDLAQLKTVGSFTLLVGCGVSLLTLTPSIAGDRPIVLGLASVYVVLGAVMLGLSRRKRLRVLPPRPL